MSQDHVEEAAIPELSQDVMLEIFANLTLKEKMRALSVSKQVTEIARMAMVKQKRIGHSPYLGSNDCETETHAITDLDLLPHPFNEQTVNTKQKFIERTIKVMRMCPNVHTIKLVLRHRITDGSYDELFKVVLELYPQKLRCLDISCIPR